MSAEETTSPNQNPGSGYDRDAIVASVTRYYELLSKMVAIKPNRIAYAPEGGRGDDIIPIEKLRRLGFNDRAIDFVRHVPFVHSIDRPVFQGTQTLNYYRNLFTYPEEEYDLVDPMMVETWPMPDQRIPEGFLPLSIPLQGSPFGWWWILDTNTGELTAHGPFLTRPSEEVPEDEQWRSSRPVPATAYFDGLCEDLKSLKLLPVPDEPRRLTWEIWFAQEPFTIDRWVQEAKEIYVQCHWPDLQKFQRAKCRRLLLDMQKRRKAWEDEERAKQPPPAAYEDASGRPVSPPDLQLEADS